MVKGTLLKCTIHWVLADVKLWPQWRDRSFLSLPKVSSCPSSIPAPAPANYRLLLILQAFAKLFWGRRHLTLVGKAKRRKRGDSKYPLFKEIRLRRKPKRSSQMQIEGGIFKNKKDFSMFTWWVEKAVERGILKLPRRLEIHDGKGAERNGSGVKSIIGGITGNKKKKNFFSKSGGEVVWDKAENRFIIVLQDRVEELISWWFDFFYRVPGKLMCWERWRREVRRCPRKIMRLWNSSCERMGADVVLYSKDY